MCSRRLYAQKYSLHVRWWYFFFFCRGTSISLRISKEAKSILTKYEDDRTFNVDVIFWLFYFKLLLHSEFWEIQTPTHTCRRSTLFCHQNVNEPRRRHYYFFTCFKLKLYKSMETIFFFFILSRSCCTVRKVAVNWNEIKF